MSDEKVDLLCEHCGKEFSAFLHEMADHNAKVTACPSCGKGRDGKAPKTAEPVARAASVKKRSSAGPLDGDRIMQRPKARTDLPVNRPIIRDKNH